MVLGGFWHMGLTVSDIGASKRFYRNCVGMEVVREPYETRNVARDELMGSAGVRMMICWLRDDRFLLQLVQYLVGGGETLDLHHNNVGSPHLSFVMDDFDSKFAELSARDDAVIASRLVDTGSARTFHVEDPDGLPVEFCQFKVVPGDLAALMTVIGAPPD
jgi:catechol 2,3-dioxygenase-like lactoylglutathione lyase family enzyme